MKIAIHQPHYFPWLGYMDKMAKVDKFIILDEVQIEKGSNMYRNKLITSSGQEKYITISYNKDSCLSIPFNQIMLNEDTDWQKRQYEFIRNNYRNTQYYNDIMNEITFIFENKYRYLIEPLMDSVNHLRHILNIENEIVYQSSIAYNREAKKNDLVLDLCKHMKTDIYLSGNGAKKYMDTDSFRNENIDVKFQEFQYPEYNQLCSMFIPNLSSLDILFHCGVEKTRNIFWGNMIREV